MMANLSKEMVSRGHDVEIILARSPGQDDYQVDERVKVTWLNAASIGKTVFRLSRVLSSGGFDVLYTAMPTTNIAALFARFLSRSRTKIVISERSNPQLEAAHSKTWRYRASFVLQPYVYPAADAIVAVCGDLADSLSDFAKIERSKIRVIYNPAFDDREQVDSFKEPPHAWLKEKTCPVIVTAGRLMVQKDYATLIEAFAQLRQHREAKLVILGEGPLRGDLEDLVDTLGVSDSVLMPGFVSDVMHWFEHADVFALSSIWEGFGNVLVQALAAGCTIVSTDCPNGPREILQNGKFGYLVPVGNPREMATAIDLAIAKPISDDLLRERAKDFSASKSADSYEKLFSELVAAGA